MGFCSFVGDGCLIFLHKGISGAGEEFDFQLRLERSNLVESLLVSALCLPLIPLHDCKEPSVFEVAEGHLLVGTCILSLYILQFFLFVL